MVLLLRGRAPPPVAPEPLTVEFRGCREFIAPAHCLVGADPRLVLWVDTDPREPLQLMLDDDPVPAEAHALGGGLQLRAQLPADHGTLSLHRPTDTSAAPDPLWSMQLRPRPAPDPTVAALQEAAPADPQGTRTRLDELLPTLEGPALLGALDLARRLDAMLGRHDSLFEVAEQEFDRSSALGYLHFAANTANATAFSSIQDIDDLELATTWLERGRRIAERYPPARIENLRYRGALDERLSRVHAAEQAYARAAEHSRRLGRSSHQAHALDDLARLQASLGRFESAQVLFERALGLLGERARHCARPILLDNLGWTLVYARAAGRDLGDPGDLFTESERLARDDPSCPSGFLGTMLVNSISSSLQHAELADVHEKLAELRTRLARDEMAGADLLAWSTELEHQAAVWNRGVTLPMLHAIETREHVARTRDSYLRWSAAWTSGRAMTQWGFHLDARAAYEDAEAQLDEDVLALGMTEGMGLRLQARVHSARALVDLLVDRGEDAQASCVARWARRRSTWVLDRSARLAALELREGDQGHWRTMVAAYSSRRRALEESALEDWRYVGAERERRRRERSAERDQLWNTLDEAYRLLGTELTPPGRDRCEALPPPRPGELTLLYFPGEDDWIGFALSHAGVVARRFAAPRWDDEAAVARVLLEPFGALLEHADRVRVMPVGPVWQVPVHALPWKGEPLLAHVPVVYGLDLNRTTAPPPAERRALVVADPSGTLPHAIPEAEAVATRLSDRGWAVESTDRARGSELRQALGEVDLLHYAGHGSREGVAGWGSTLHLAQGTTLGVPDILALPRAPSTVILAGCETDATDRHSLAGGMSLARAFLLAGASVVVAATEEVDDEAAAGLVEALYDRAPTDSPFDGADRLRRAQLQLRAARPDVTTWRDFRALVP